MTEMKDFEKKMEDALGHNLKIASDMAGMLSFNSNSRLTLELDVDFDEAIELINHLKKMRHPDGEKAGEA